MSADRQANRDYRIPSALKPWWKPWMSYVLSFAGFTWATLGYFNRPWKLNLPSPLFSHYSEIFAIVVYGIPLIFILRDRYQKIRMIIMVILLFTLWYLVPALFVIDVNVFGAWPVMFPGIDMPGAWTGIVLFGVALLFGRRVKCGWMNTCVALKETAGAPFRKFTKRGLDYFWLAKIKYLTGFFYVLYFVLIFMPESAFRNGYFYWFWIITVYLYFGSLYFAPVFGSRVWCRWLCPFMFGWANVFGFFRLVVDNDKCDHCGICEKNCDFGLPILALARKNPRIRTTECMGCGRCRSACPKKAISFYDVRNYLSGCFRK